LVLFYLVQVQRDGRRVPSTQDRITLQNIAPFNIFFYAKSCKNEKRLILAWKSKAMLKFVYHIYEFIYARSFLELPGPKKTFLKHAKKRKL